MPCSQIVAVVTLFRIACGLAKVIKVRGSSPGMRLVISGRRPCARLVPSPGWPVAVGKLFGGAIRIGKISGNKDCARNRIEQLGGGLSAGQIVATGNIARANKDWVRPGG